MAGPPRPTSGFRTQNRVHVAEPPERRPLLRSNTGLSYREANSGQQDPTLDSIPNSHAHLPVYTTILRIRRDIVAAVEDYLSLDRLKDVGVNISLIRPLVDKYYDQDDVSIGKLCLV